VIINIFFVIVLIVIRIFRPGILEKKAKQLAWNRDNKGLGLSINGVTQILLQWYHPRMTTATAQSHPNTAFTIFTLAKLN
jgi:hypothetical protein